MVKRRKNCAECGKKIVEVHRSPIFCAPCDRERIARIDQQFKAIEQRFKEREAGK